MSAEGCLANGVSAQGVSTWGGGVSAWGGDVSAWGVSARWGVLSVAVAIEGCVQGRVCLGGVCIQVGVFPSIQWGRHPPVDRILHTRL